MKPTDLSNLSDEALLGHLARLCAVERTTEIETILTLIELEDRRLHLLGAYSSLFDFCRRELRLSEGAAFRRINAARLVRRFPSLLRHLEKGDTNLSALVLMRDHLTEANVDHLVEAARGKSKMQIRELLARIAARPDGPSRLRKLPSTNKTTSLVPAVEPQDERLAEARYRFQTTLSRGERDRFQYARDLLSYLNTSGDLNVVFMRAIDTLIETLETQLFGQPLAKAKVAGEDPAPRPLARAIRREAPSPKASDEGQCSFVDEDGERCSARRALGRVPVGARDKGPAGAPRFVLRCRAHGAKNTAERASRPSAKLPATFAGKSAERRVKLNGTRHGP